MADTKIEVKVRGTVTGWVRPGETEEDAKARAVLEAEMGANAVGDPRLHLSVVAMETCPLCKGTGKTDTPSFKDASKTIQRTCSVCKGSGKMEVESEPQK